MKGWVRILIGIGISAALLLYLLPKTELSAVQDALGNISLPLLAGASAIYVLILIIRTARFHLLIRTPIAFHDLGAIVASYTLLSNTLPLKAGELSFVFLAKKTLPSGERIMGWLVSRLLDFITLAGLFLTIVAFQVTPLSQARGAVLIVFALLIGLLASATLLGPRSLPLIKWLLVKTYLWRIKLIAHVFAKGESALSEFARIRNPLVLIGACALSVLIWMLHAFFLVLLFGSLGVTLTYVQGILLLSILALLLALPLQGIASLGTYEGGVAFALLSFGISTSNAVAVAISSHALSFLMLLIVGLPSLAYTLSRK